MPEPSDLNAILAKIDSHLRCKSQVIAARAKLDGRFSEIEAELNALNTAGRALVACSSQQGPYFTDLHGQLWHLRGADFVKIPTVPAETVKGRGAATTNGPPDPLRITRGAIDRLALKWSGGDPVDDCGSEPPAPPAIRPVDEEPEILVQRDGDVLAGNAT